MIAVSFDNKWQREKLSLTDYDRIMVYFVDLSLLEKLLLKSIQY